MKALATVLPTRIVHRKFSGFSRYSSKTPAERRPARVCCRMRSRLKAKTPASMPDMMKDNIKEKNRASQKIELVATRLIGSLLQLLDEQLTYAALVDNRGGEF